jgi:putative glutamine amidotransferase
MAPLIGVTTSAERTSKGVDRAFLNASYVRAIERAGGIPVLLTPYHSPGAVGALWERLDGILLTGGGDIAPERFHESPHPETTLISPERDVLELDLVTRRAIDEGKPLLAICRGLQVLNVALDGCAMPRTRHAARARTRSAWRRAPSSRAWSGARSSA